MHPPEPQPAALTTPDPWSYLRRYTAARIAIGRSGGSQPTAAVLDFRLAHARARDAVHAPFDAAGLAEQLRAAGIESEFLSTAVVDRRTYLLRPDLGRSLDENSRSKLVASQPDLALIVSDGLAAAAAERHALATLLPLIRELREAGWKISPVYLVPLARVKVQDEIGAALGARHSLMLLGERPGLGSPDSLGAYFTSAPSAGCTDADRNCVSNIRPEGLPPAEAAAKLVWLLKESARLGLSGVHLKDTQPAVEIHGRSPSLQAE
ncbi:ethanolamine ammonia-lyase subunit EutC [bacterium]|nr:ethanolamine ammonia-lyase subunit EutC [bacterium]